MTIKQKHLVTSTSTEKVQLFNRIKTKDQKSILNNNKSQVSDYLTGKLFLSISQCSLPISLYYFNNILPHLTRSSTWPFYKRFLANIPHIFPASYILSTCPAHSNLLPFTILYWPKQRNAQTDGEIQLPIIGYTLSVL